MSIKVKELAEKAHQMVNQEYPGWLSEPGAREQLIQDKFAELIVKETMQVVANTVPQNTYLDAAEAVIKHFK